MILPIPEVCGVSIDFSETETGKVKGLLFGRRDEVLHLKEKAYEEAEALAVQKAIEQGILDEARDAAREALVPLLGAYGTRKVEITFSDEHRML